MGTDRERAKCRRQDRQALAWESTVARGVARKSHYDIKAPEMSYFVQRCPGVRYDIVQSANI